MRAYSLYDLVNFPDSSEFSTTLQTDHTYTVENTRFLRTGTVNGIFTVYRVEHISPVRFRGLPFHHGEQLDEVSEKHSFDAYVDETRSYMLMQYSRKVSREAARRLAKLETRTLATAPSLDMARAATEFPRLFGSYFRDVQSTTVKSSALFGPDVDTSEFYKSFASQAKLSAVIADFDLGSETHKILVTAAYGIGFYRPLSQSTELAVIQALKPMLDRFRIQSEKTERIAEEPNPLDDELGTLFG